MGSKEYPRTIAGETPVRREQGEAMQMFGRRRKAQIRRWFDAGIDADECARVHGVSITYVNDIVGIRSAGYEWVPPDSVIYENIPTYAQAWEEEPLIPEDAYRMTTEQAIQRAIQMYRWLQAGMTMKQIGQRHGISKERVRRILNKFGLWRPYQTKWERGEPVPIPAPEDNIAGGKPWFFRRKKEGEPKWWERD